MILNGNGDLTGCGLHGTVLFQLFFNRSIQAHMGLSVFSCHTRIYIQTLVLTTLSLLMHTEGENEKRRLYSEIEKNFNNSIR